MMRPTFFTRTRTALRLNWKRLLSELLVVFIGVYAAFWLSTYKEENLQRQIRQNFYQSFKKELDNINKRAKEIAAAADTLNARYSQAIAQGERPLLMVHPQMDFTTNMFVIRSTFNHQHLETMDPFYLANISHGSTLITLLEKRLDLFQEKSRALMLHTGGDPGMLYHADGSLKPAFQWYLQDLQYISAVSKSLTTAIEQGANPDTDRLIKELEK